MVSVFLVIVLLSILNAFYQARSRNKSKFLKHSKLYLKFYLRIMFHIKTGIRLIIFPLIYGIVKQISKSLQFNLVRDILKYERN